MRHRAGNFLLKTGTHAGTVPGTSSKVIALHLWCPGAGIKLERLARGILSLVRYELFSGARTVFAVFRNDANNPQSHARKAQFPAIKPRRWSCTKRCRCPAVSCEGDKSHRFRTDALSAAWSQVWTRVQFPTASVQWCSLKSSERHFYLVNQQFDFLGHPPRFMGIRGKVGCKWGQLAKSQCVG